MGNITASVTVNQVTATVIGSNITANVTPQVVTASLGVAGAQGAAGVGVPAGGTTGQVLEKNSNTSYDTLWATPAAGGVTSFNSRSGVVLAATGDYSIGMISGAGTLASLNSVDLSGSLATGILAAARFPALTGDVTTTAGNLTTALAIVNSNVGSFTNANITVNAKGLVTAAANGSSGAPGGSNTYIQYNNAGAFAGSSNLTWTNSSNTLNIGIITGTSIGPDSAVFGGAVTVNNYGASGFISFQVLDANGRQALLIDANDIPGNGDYVQTMNNVLDDGAGNSSSTGTYTNTGGKITIGGAFSAAPVITFNGTSPATLTWTNSSKVLNFRDNGATYFDYPSTTSAITINDTISTANQERNGFVSWLVATASQASGFLNAANAGYRDTGSSAPAVGTAVGVSGYNYLAGTNTRTIANLYGQFAANEFAGTSVTVTNAYGIYTNTNYLGGGTGVITNSYGAYLDNPTNPGTITTSYGLYVAAQTHGTTNWDIYAPGTHFTFGAFNGILTAASGVLSASGAASSPWQYYGTPSDDSGSTTPGWQPTNTQYIDLVATAALPTYTYFSAGNGGPGDTLTATSNGPLTVDLKIVTTGQYILVPAEANANRKYQGVYKVTQPGVTSVSPYILTRATFADTPAKLFGAHYFVINGGATQSESLWINANTAGTLTTIGTSTITYVNMVAFVVQNNGGTLTILNRSGADVAVGTNTLTDSLGNNYQCSDNRGGPVGEFSFMATGYCTSSSGYVVDGGLANQFDGSADFDAGLTGNFRAPGGTMNLLVGTGTNGSIVLSPDGTGQVVLPASTTSAPALVISSGGTPSSPSSGWMWFDGTNVKFRVGATTKTFTLV